MSILSNIYSLFVEKKCYSCQKEWHFFCPQCQWNMQVYEPYCYACKIASENFYVHKECQKYFLLSRVVVLAHYRSPYLPKLLKAAKYYKKSFLYGDMIQNNRSFFHTYISSDNSILVPVPMYFLRRWKRWYNQSNIIADKLWKVLWIPVEKKLVKRCKSTILQSTLSQQQRKNNISWAFSLNSNTTIPKNINIILVDDIVSTGSTLLEITKLLHCNGYKNVSAVCLASD